MTAATHARMLRLRYPAKCAVCFRRLEPGEKAEWNSRRRVAICIQCVQARPAARSQGRSVAGGSAQAEATRRRAKQQDRLQGARDAHPFWARAGQRLFPEKDAGAAWEKGAVGEEKLAAFLGPMAEAGSITVLHDRRIPGTRANIDHLVITADGVWVVDAKCYAGLIKRDFRGNVFTGGNVLSVQGRDRSSLIDGVKGQTAKVEAVLRNGSHGGVVVRGVLCFIDGHWGWRWRPFSLSGVFITWPRALRKRLEEAGTLNADERRAIRAQLEAAFPPAS